MALNLKFVQESRTGLARLYEDRHGAQQWVPVSVCKRTLKHAASAGQLAMHEVEIEPWWLEKNPWPPGQRELGL